MLVHVSTQEFHARQPHYLSMVRRGEHVALRSRGGRYRIIFESQEEESEKDVTDEICQAMKDWKDYLDGDSSKMLSWEELVHELQN